MVTNTARFRSFPLPAMLDKELSNPEFDVLVAKCHFHNDFGPKYWEKPATVRMLAKYTSYSERRIREVLPRLVELGYLSFERSAQKIVDIRWGAREDIQKSVQRREGCVWVRLPVLILEDTALRPHERRAYLAIVNYSFRHEESFYLSSRKLGELLGVGYQTAARTLKSLRDRGLVGYLPARNGDSVSRMFHSPIEVAYPDAEHDDPKPRKSPSTKDLLDLFEEKYHQALGSDRAKGWTKSGALNRGRLGSHIKRWIKKDGVSPEVVAAMIQIFFESDSRFIRSGREEVWKQFINSNAVLEQWAKNRTKNWDDLGWDDLPDEDDVDLGWGDLEEITNSEH